MQLILFLVLVNSHTESSWYLKVSPFLFLIIILSSESLSANSYPNCLAALTRASSSGDEELYFPFFVSIMMV